MKGIITAGGLGTRLYPLTHATNKHLLPIYDKPMIYYPIQTLVSAGITEVLIVVGGPHAGHFMRVLKNGKNLGLTELQFAYQDKEDGIGGALKLGEDFADKESIAVILGDNTTDTDISDDVKKFKRGGKIFLKKVPDPERYGVPVFDKNKKIIKIEEKPKKPKSDYAVTGLYLYDKNWFKHLKSIKPSKRGEIEITALNNKYIKEGNMQWSELNRYWQDTGKFETLYEANKHWSEKANK